MQNSKNSEYSVSTVSRGGVNNSRGDITIKLHKDLLAQSHIAITIHCPLHEGHQVTQACFKKNRIIIRAL